MKSLKHLLAGFAMLALGTAAQAALVQIQLSGLNLVYSQATGQFCTDTDGDAGCETDPLVTVSVLSNGGVLGVFLVDLEADVSGGVAAGTDPNVNDGNALTSLGIFDVYFGAYSILTDMTIGQVTFSNGSVNIGGTGFSSIFTQNLPFGLVAENPINWSFSSGQGTCTGATGALVCTYAGTGELAWTTSEIAEPGTLALLGLGLFGAGLARRRRS